jgi:4-amino-4-deoxy-L-arabinose transferase-like glycosyltransferase
MAVVGSGPVRGLAVLLLAAVPLFTAGINALSLPSLEDAFYAREAVEMARTGRVFTVTWDGEPTHQHPPLQLWVVGRAFALFGETDGVARLPSVLMALGILAVTYRIGVLTVGGPAALAGVALLLATPLFVTHARRVMMEVPLTLWTATTVLLFLEGRRRPWCYLALAGPLGAAILTKSVLGLMPLFALAGAAAGPEGRAALRRPGVWAGVALGLAIGASWPLHQFLTQGPGAVSAHFLGHVLRRSTRSFDALRAVSDYAVILVKFYQPVVIPGLVGLWLLFRQGRARPAGEAILAAWVVLPVVLYSLSSFRTPRFLFPILPALALAAGWWLARRLPRVALLLATRIVPLSALAVALVLGVMPAWLTRDLNAPFKRGAASLRAAVPAHARLPYLGNHYWLVASPLLYYAERRLDRSSGSAEAALEAARGGPSGLLLCARPRLPEVMRLGVPTRTLLEGRGWALLAFDRAESTAPGTPTTR